MQLVKLNTGHWELWDGLQREEDEVMTRMNISVEQLGSESQEFINAA